MLDVKVFVVLFFHDLGKLVPGEVLVFRYLLCNNIYGSSCCFVGLKSSCFRLLEWNIVEPYWLVCSFIF